MWSDNRMYDAPARTEDEVHAYSCRAELIILRRQHMQNTQGQNGLNELSQDCTYLDKQLNTKNKYKRILFAKYYVYLNNSYNNIISSSLASYIEMNNNIWDLCVCLFHN